MQYRQLGRSDLPFGTAIASGQCTPGLGVNLRDSASVGAALFAGAEALPDRALRRR